MSKKIKLSLIFTLVLSVMVCLLGGIMMQSASASNEYQSFVMQDLASIKMGEETGIRFTTEISKSDYQAVKTKYGEDAKIEIITVITRTDYLNKYEIADADFTIDNLLEKGIFFKNIKFSVENGRFVDDGDKYVCKACLYDVDVTNVAEEFSARSFLCVNDSVIDETDYSEEKNAWSVYEVAKIFNGQLEEEQNAILAELCADYEIKIAATDYNEETSITVKVGETINDYKAEIESKLNVENFAYFAGLEGADMNAPVESGATYTPNYRAVIMEENETGYTVKGITLKDTDTTVIEIPETFNGKTVNTVGSGAFWGNLGAGGHNESLNYEITKIVLPESVTTIKDRAFSHLGKLETIIMPGVKEVSPDSVLAFYDCVALESIVVDDSFTASGTYGDVNSRIFFYDAPNPVKVDICYSTPNGWSSVNHYDYCNKMLSGKEYYYSENDCLNTWHYDDNGNVVKSSVASHGAYENGVCTVCGRIQTTGVRYALNEDGESYKVSSYSGTDKEIYVAGVYNGKPVTAVGDSAFANKEMTKVVLPKSVTTLGGNAFFRSYNLETVIMPGVTNISSGTTQFHDDKGLKVIVVGESFAITNGGRCFSGDSGYQITGVKVLISSKDGAYNVTGTDWNNINLKGAIIYHYNEKDCVNTWRYTDSTKTDIIISNVTEHSYEDGLCENCGALQTAGLIYTLRDDGQSYKVTGYTGSATEIYVAKEYNGKPVTEIGENAFWRYANTNFTNYNVTKVVLPTSVTMLGTRSLSQMAELETVIMPGVTYIDSTVDKMQFYGCESLKTVVVGESFKIIGDINDGFSRTFHYDDKVSKITDIYLTSKDGVADIFSLTDRNKLLTGNFYHYSEIDCLNTWRYDASGNIVKSTVVAHGAYKDGVCENCGAHQSEGLVYTLNEDGESYSVTGYTGTSTEVYVAGTYLGKPVTAVGACAFWTYSYPNTGKTNNGNITKIVLPKSVTTLGGSCFREQKNLQAVIMPGVTKIDTSVASMQFFNHLVLTTVVVGETFTVSGSDRCFQSDQSGAQSINIYITSENGGYSISSWGYINKNGIYNYSATEQAGYWHYDANGMPVLW